ncbi:response regulator transcription factor [Companilactobacillus alimentarius]|uniref:response regulator transcription factor n=1 Tax=Companilactobacillus alimentarius TaxID=1602 RepID=UPI0028BABFFB|nr:response regulator transcription factor [Companilactobacillus alimentarius]MDT6953381.1 response regulator transcription factor [Companilactobacillus alimentarius]
MYSVLIIDDEYMILKGLEKIIKWSDYGFEVVKSARNAKQALEYLSTNEINLIITDVNMPKINGLEFVKIAKEQGHQFEFMILSGYQEFDYVRTGLKLGAVDYILKPIDANALVEALKKVKHKLDSQIVMRQDSRTSLNLQIKKLFENDLDKNQIVALFHQLRINPELIGHGLTVIACNRVDDTERIDHLCDEYGQVLKFSQGRVIDIGFIGGRGKLLKFVRELEDRQIITGESFITVGETVYDWNNISQSYEQAVRLSTIYKFYEKSNEFSSNKLRVDWLKQATLPKISLVKVKQAIALDDCEELDKEFLQIFSELSKQGASPSYVRQIAFLIYSEINAKIGHNNDDYQGYVMRINNSENLQDIINILKEVLEKVSVGDPLNKDYSENIRRVIEIIKKNYQDDLNLRYVSDCLHLNSDYLGQLFKKELKMSFSKYLNEYRIEQAQYLLKETKQSVSEISSKVGYMTTAYFYRKFKIICGISPKEYRKKYV